MSKAYCELAPGHAVHGSYHDMEYGFPTESEEALLERLALEIMQAGLSWEITLKKRKATFKAFDKFKAAKVAAYKAKDIKRLLGDEGIIRNKLKIAAIIHNANVILDMRKSHGGFAKWLQAQAGQTAKNKQEWVQLFKKTFKFTGGEITGEFLMSIGYLPGAHWEGCPVYKKIARLKRR
jgi:DNA-3-methyladenine glycosylase I